MEMKLIDVALALVAMYLVMSLAATQICELLAAATKSRQRTLHSVIKEAFRGNEELIQKFYGYAPIFALSQGNAKPSAIPPELFASGFLAVLGGNKPPRSEFQTPAQFVAQAGKAGVHIQQILEANVAGTEADWNAFERRIAVWFTDICDRSEGWYKRSNTVRLVIVSIFLTLALNADTTFIARSLMENDELRTAAANIGELIANQIEDDKLRQKGEPIASRDKLVSASLSAKTFGISAELDIAMAEIRGATELVPQLFAYGQDKGEIAETCLYFRLSDGKKAYDSNFESWPTLLPGIFYTIESASLGVRDNGAPMDSNTRPVEIRKALACTTAIAAWLHAAQYSTRNKEARERMAAAVQALERAREKMQALISSITVQSNLVKAFAQLGPMFQQCVYGAGSSRADFDRCLATSNRNVLPFGWPSQLGQFCTVTIRRNSATPSALGSPERERDGGMWGCQDFIGSPELDLPPIYATLDTWKLAAALLGWALTAILVSLGAPFWYGVIGKVATLRMAGRVRGLDDSSSGKSANPPVKPTQDGTALSPEQAPFDSAMNEFERAMRPQEISRLQIALGLPPTMQLDEVTRNAFASRLKDLGQPPDREIGATTYYLVVGRQTGHSVPVSRNAEVWKVGYQDAAAVPALVAALNDLFPASKNWPQLANTDVVSQELRARVVLFRFRADKAAAPQEKGVVTLANSAAGEMMTIDPATRTLIETKRAEKDVVPFARDKAPWLDFAYGELGVRESNIGGGGSSRIEQYLKAMSDASHLTATGTAWCGAFVGWVLIQAGKLAPNPKRPELLLASNWKGFGQVTNTPKSGDICVVQTGDGFHVAFFIELDANGGPWLLGGNQGDPSVGGVTLMRFSAAKNTFTYITV